MLNDWQEELLAEGRLKGMIEGIISVGRGLHASDEFIIAQLMKQTSMDQAEDALKRSH